VFIKNLPYEMKEADLRTAFGTSLYSLYMCTLYTVYCILYTV
jgi:hypothetical protein